MFFPLPPILRLCNAGTAQVRTREAVIPHQRPLFCREQMPDADDEDPQEGGPKEVQSRAGRPLFSWRTYTVPFVQTVGPRTWELR